MPPGQKCHTLWHYFRVGPGLGQRAHVLQVARAESLHPWKPRLKIAAEPIDHLGSPTLRPLSEEDLGADRPVEQDQLTRDRQGRTGL